MAATGSRAIETKERKAFPRTRPSRCRCPRARQPNTIKQPTNERARGHTFFIYFWGVIRKKNDNRYERVQKIDPRNTLRGMKTKETIFLK